MKVIQLDATNWTKKVDFGNALVEALGGVEGVGRSVDALLEVMIWSDDLAKIRPPYRIQISGTAGLPEDVIEEIRFIERVLPHVRAEYRARRGADIEVSFETDIKT
jgi:hypothetical protein